MSIEGGDRAPKMARKLGRGLGNLIPVPLPPKASETSGASVPVSAPTLTPNVPGSGRSTGNIDGAAKPASAASTPVRSVSPSMLHVTARSTTPTVISAPGEAPAPRGPISAVSTNQASVSGVGFGDSGQTDSDGGTSYRVVPVALISRNPWQPREMFHEEQIRELAQSIESAGLMQPLVVRAKGKGFELIAGERRLRALTLLKRTEAPVVIHDVDDQIAAEWALIENLQREDLNPMERATAMQRLVVEFELTHEELADRLGLKRASVTNILSLNHLDAKTAALVRAGSLSAGHAKCLLSVDSLAERSRLAEACVKESWPVRKLEQETKRTRERSTGNNRLPATRSISAHVADLERQLTEHLGTKVTIQMGRKPNTGRVVLQFYSNAQFDGLLQAMNFSNDGL